jgi:methionyl-tRNA formyltransferase
MKLIYMGTPEFAVAPLQALCDAGHEIAAVVTQPDRPNSRRGNQVVFSPVKQAAEILHLPVRQPERVSDAESHAYLASLKADAVVVCAYGQLLAKNILNLTPFGCLNLHASLLPKYRGAAPMHRCIIDGETETGVTIMYMDEGLDTGDMMISETVPIPFDMTVGILHDALAACGSGLIVRARELLRTGNAPRMSQDENKSSYAEKITKAECEVDFSKDASDVYNLIRGLNPYPTAYTYFNGKIIKLYDVAYSGKCYNTSAGTVQKVGKDELAVSCQNGSIFLKTVKPEGKRLMTATEFWIGLHGKENVRFGR